MPHKNKEQGRAYHNLYEQKKREDAVAAGIETPGQKRYRERIEYYRNYQAAGAAKRRAQNTKRKQELRAEIIYRYGGSCACCGESNPMLLEIDHAKNNGAEHRKMLRAAGTTLYTWIRKNGYPKDFQLLCSNCNLAKYRHGFCPHSPAVATEGSGGGIAIGWCTG